MVCRSMRRTIFHRTRRYAQWKEKKRKTTASASVGLGSNVRSIELHVFWWQAQDLFEWCFQCYNSLIHVPMRFSMWKTFYESALVDIWYMLSLEPHEHSLAIQSSDIIMAIASSSTHTYHAALLHQHHELSQKKRVTMARKIKNVRPSHIYIHFRVFPRARFGCCHVFQSHIHTHTVVLFIHYALNRSTLNKSS